MMECLNHFGPVIQAFAAIVTAFSALVALGLTLVLVRLTRRYVGFTEALQKPCVTVQSEPRTSEDAVADGYAAQVSQQKDFVVIENIGIGPALKVRYRFYQTNAPPGGPVSQAPGFVDYLLQRQPRSIPVPRGPLATIDYDFEADYESLSGKKYRTKIKIEDRKIVCFSC